MALYWHDIRFPSKLLRTSEELFSHRGGLIHPRLLNIGFLLGCGAWRGLPKQPDMKARITDLAMDPSCGADIIVSILYQHSPGTLVTFFEADRFAFCHEYAGDDPNAAPRNFERFAIRRIGAYVRAGHFKDDIVDGVLIKGWNSYVEYELINMSNDEVWWRQTTMQEHGQLALDQCDIVEEPLTLADRAIWEMMAIVTLAPALSERRWKTQPGVFQVEVIGIPPGRTSQDALSEDGENQENCSEFEEHNAYGVVNEQRSGTDEAEKLAQSTRAMSEVDYDAEGETVMGDSPPKPESGSSGVNMVAPIPGTEDFDDVSELLRAAEAKANTRGERLNGGHRVGKVASKSYKAWAPMDKILAMTKRTAGKETSST